MSETISAVLPDVDRTLLRHGHKEVSSEVKAAVDSLTVPLMPVTGRSYPLMQRLVEPLHLRSLATLDGGATVVRAATGERLWSQWLAPTIVQRVVREIGGVCSLLSCEAEYRPFNPAEVDVSAFTIGEDSPSVFGVHPLSQQGAVEQALQDIPGIKYRVMGYEDDPLQRCVQITSLDVDKEYGVRQMLGLAGLADARILVIGDDFKGDEPLFRAAGEHGIKIAMGNASDELKDIADWVAPSVEEHGFAVAMERYGLLAD